MLMRKIKWEVEYTVYPVLVKYCKKCREKTEFFSSGRFRVNANGKNLDIWLIYKCQKCSNTMNLKVYSRIPVQKLGRDTLEKFYSNDKNLAKQCSVSLAKRVDSTETEYKINGENIEFSEPTELHIVSENKIRVSKLLRRKLGISAGELKKLVESGYIKSDSECDLMRCKFRGEMVLYLCR